MAVSGLAGFSPVDILEAFVYKVCRRSANVTLSRGQTTLAQLAYCLLFWHSLISLLAVLLAMIAIIA